MLIERINVHTRKNPIKQCNLDNTLMILIKLIVNNIFKFTRRLNVTSKARKN